MKVNLVWAILERMLPRASAAIILLLFSMVAQPAIVGIYSAVAIATIFIQSTFEITLKQYAVPLSTTKAGRHKLARLQFAYAVVGVLAICGMIAYLLLGKHENLVRVLETLPLILVPIFSSMSLRIVAELQLRGNWKSLAKAQGQATIAGLVVGFPVTAFTASPIGPTIVLVAIESIFYWRVRSLHQGTGNREHQVPAQEASGMGAFGLSSLLTWAQLNLDRLVVTLLAGPAMLALYTLSWAFSRSLVDAMSGGVNNLLRTQIYRQFGEHGTMTDLTKVTSLVLRSPLVISFGVGLAQTLGSILVLPLVLGAEWSGALTAIPIMSAVTPLVIVEAALVVSIVSRGRGIKLVPIRIFGLSAAIFVGAVAAIDISLAAVIVVGRQMVTLSWTYAIAPRTISKRLFIQAVAGSLLLLSGGLAYYIIVRANS